METRMKESARWLFTVLSLFLRHQGGEVLITSAATAPLLQADGEEWTPSKTEKEAVLKDRSSGTISGAPTLVPRSRDLIFCAGSE